MEPELFIALIAKLSVSSVVLLGGFFHFRSNTMHQFLIGEGKAALRRADANEEVYKALNNDLDRYGGRLRDAVLRKSAEEVKEAIYELAKYEAKKKDDIKDTGLAYVYCRFNLVYAHLTELRRLFILNIVLNIILLAAATLHLALCSVIHEYCQYTYGVVFFISCVVSIFLVIYSNYKKTTYENLKGRRDLINNRKIEDFLRKLKQNS